MILSIGLGPRRRIPFSVPNIVSRVFPAVTTLFFKFKLVAFRRLLVLNLSYIPDRDASWLMQVSRRICMVEKSGKTTFREDVTEKHKIAYCNLCS